jgi:hypothetical protein
VSQSDIDRLAELVLANERADKAQRAAYQRVEPDARAAREARVALMWEAAKIVINDPTMAAEVATQLAYDGQLTRANAECIAREIGDQVQWHLRELIQKAWEQ